MVMKKEILEYLNYLAEYGYNDTELIEKTSNDLKVSRHRIEKIMFQRGNE